MKEKVKDDYANKVIEYLSSIDSKLTAKDKSRICGCVYKKLKIVIANEKATN